MMSIETDGLLSIGRFAQATGLSVKALRHYAQLGLLVPAHVDRRTGYRYYAVAQLRAGTTIARLRALDVPLPEVAPLLSADEDTLRERLSVHRDRLASRVDETRRLLDALDRIIDGEEALVTEATIERLTVRQVPARSYVIKRDRRPMEELQQLIPATIGEVGAWVFGHGGPDGAPMARIGPADQDGVVDIEIGWPMATPVDPPAPLSTTTYPEIRAVVHQHIGPYDALCVTYAALERAMAAAGLRPTGPARECYETDPAEEPDAQKWVTEIIWPVE